MSCSLNVMLLNDYYYELRAAARVRGRASVDRSHGGAEAVTTVGERANCSEMRSLGGTIALCLLKLTTATAIFSKPICSGEIEREWALALQKRASECEADSP